MLLQPRHLAGRAHRKRFQDGRGRPGARGVIEVLHQQPRRDWWDLGGWLWLVLVVGVRGNRELLRGVTGDADAVDRADALNAVWDELGAVRIIMACWEFMGRVP